MTNTPKNLEEYRKNLRDALNDEFLRDTLERFSKLCDGRRIQTYEGRDRLGMIAKVTEIKDQTAKNNQELIDKFSAKASELGIKVHIAKDAEHANNIIAEIAKENDVKSVVKVKSMTTEETELNKHLTKQGIEINETDLGEWIIQLREDRPSHIIAPAVHLSKEQVAEVFSAATAKTQPAIIEKLVKVSRRGLREAFAKADMGISGANFAVAENGSLVIVTNEGNARMVTSLPRVHVAICGIDKLVEKMDDVLHTLMVLPRNAVGQVITSYVDIITGPNECSSSPTDKKIMHVVLLDNGRSKIMQDPLFSQVARCIRCGACSNICPIYLMIGGHQMGHIYNGPIGLILTYLFHGKDKAKTIIQNCVGCERCKDVCGGGIDLPRIIREIRMILSEDEGAGIQNSILSAAMKNRKMFHSLLRMAKIAQKPITGGTQFIRHLPQMFMPGQEFRALPAIADKPFRDLFNEIKPKTNNPKYKIAIFGGCTQDFVYPEQLEAAVKVIAKHNVEIDFPDEQTCCGLPLTMMGQREPSKAVAIQNIEAFNVNNYDYILTLCASCASHLKKVYPQMLEDSNINQEEIKKFSSKIIDFSSFVHDVLKLSIDDFNKSEEKVTYHASCHLCRGLGVEKAPRELIKMAADYTPCEEENVCCGFGGTYSMKFPELSAEILKRKLDKAELTDATRLVADCPGCVIQLRGGEEKRSNKLHVTHIAELLAEKLKD